MAEPRDEREPTSGAFYAPAFKGNVSASGMHRFEAERLDRDGIAGRLYTERPQEFMGVTFEYEATFLKQGGWR